MGMTLLLACVVALVAMTPLVAVQIMGLVHARKMKKAESLEAAGGEELDEIVDLEDEA